MILGTTRLDTQFLSDTGLMTDFISVLSVPYITEGMQVENVLENWGIHLEAKAKSKHQRMRLGNNLNDYNQ